MAIVIGTAGWSIARQDAAAFPEEGSALERYARIFPGVEVNSSFYRPHRASTWAKWAASVPDDFRFAVKVPKTITHLAKLADTDALAAQFVEQIEPLGTKLAVLLVQLPPKLAFDSAVAEHFFAHLQDLIAARIVCEARHATWFDGEADAMLDRLRVARVAADPAVVPAGAAPGGWRGFAYWRLHGSPAMYRSSYENDAIDSYAAEIRTVADKGRDAWCIFDNTAASAATGNALSLVTRLEQHAPGDRASR